jgi:hypothetical protein
MTEVRIFTLLALGILIGLGYGYILFSARRPRDSRGRFAKRK